MTPRDSKTKLRLQETSTAPATVVKRLPFGMEIVRLPNGEELVKLPDRIADLFAPQKEIGQTAPEREPHRTVSPEYVNRRRRRRRTWSEKGEIPPWKKR